MLTSLPDELLEHIYTYLPTPGVNQVSLTCSSLYTSTLPTLYSTIVLSFRSHIRQIEVGIQNTHGILYQVVRHHTKSLVLKCKSGQHRLVFDARSLLKRLDSLQTITLTDFHTLPISSLNSLLTQLPCLNKVSLRYCDLILGTPTATATTTPITTIKRLEFYWTNFPKEAIDPLLHHLPALTHVHLHANHNRHFMANNHSLEILAKYCPDIVDLVVGLQEVDEATLVECIQRYGTQLQRLSVRIHSTATIGAITQYAPLVQDLEVRFPTRPDGLMAVLYHCHHLERVQVVSSMPLPPILHQTKVPEVESILVLDHDQLKQIRSLAPLDVDITKECSLFI